MDLAAAPFGSMNPPHVQEPLVVDMMEGKLAESVGSSFDRDVSSTQQMPLWDCVLFLIAV